MPRDWSGIAEASDGIYEVQDFKQALYQLVAQQCLYLRHQKQAVSYRLVSSYRKEFAEALDLMGLRLGFNDHFEYCYVTQEFGTFAAIDLQDTLFLLTLRHVYHLRANTGDLTINGEAIVGIPEFEENFKLLCKRDLDTKTESLKSLLRMANRHGLAKTFPAPEGDPQPFAVLILPGITDVLSEHAVSQFGAYLSANLLNVDESSEQQEADL